MYTAPALQEYLQQWKLYHLLWYNNANTYEILLDNKWEDLSESVREYYLQAGLREFLETGKAEAVPSVKVTIPKGTDKE